MRDDVILFETAKLARDKGFKVPCDGRYFWEHKWQLSLKGAVKCSNDSDIKDRSKVSYCAPTQSLIQKWLRDEFKIYVTISSLEDGEAILFDYAIKQKSPIFGFSNIRVNSDEFKTYEEALETGIEKALNLIKSKK
jgi:hypothetical protein